MFDAIRSRVRAEHRTAAARRVNDERFRSVVENSPFGIYRVTANGAFVTVNRALCAIVGLSEPELFASNISALYADPADRARLVAEHESQPNGTPVDVAWRHKDGRPITVRVWVYADRDDSGRIIHLNGYVEDVTPMRATEEALRQAEKLAALGQLVSGVAHELNNPLSAILLFTEDLLIADRPADERDALGIIAQQARRSRAIVRDLLSFVRSRDVIREPLDSATFLAQLARVMQPQLAELRVTLHIDVPTTNLTLNVDRAGIEQVITNLVVNAAQAAGPGGSVWLKAYESSPDLVIEVIDNGPGIPADVLPRVFEPFFTTKPTGQGTGLGLSVSLGLVQQHGGTLVAENVGSGVAPEGARFTVRLPLPEPAIADEDLMAVDDTSAPPLAGRRLLLVDDEETIRRALSRFFTRRGWSVTEAEHGGRALEQLRDAAHPYDLVISDVKMPEVSGIELHAALRASRPEVLDRVLFCTGEVESPAVAAFLAETRCRVLLKPFDLRTLATLSDEIASHSGVTATAH